MAVTDTVSDTEPKAAKPRRACKEAAAKPDKVLLAAVDLAREAAESIATRGTVGEYEGAVMLGERLAMHYFTCTNKGYRGWRWAIAVARAPRAKVATVCETNLLPGDDALLSPQWLPYAQRLAPGDIGAGDVMPYVADDPNLEQGFEATGDEDVDAMAFFELGLGRPRVLSRKGREAAATRWYEGEHGPRAAVAAQAKGQCGGCGYFLPMAGALRRSFGVCTNEWSPSDGTVVSLDHGCGAHSEIDEPAPVAEKVEPPRLDDFAVDVEQAEQPAETD